MVYQKIFVALDNAPQANAVFDKALEIATQYQAELLLFHCLPIEHPEVSAYSGLHGENLVNFSRMMQDHLANSTETTRKWLEAYGDRANHAGVKTDWTWKLGEAGKLISQAAKAWDADLIVIGRRGRSGLAEMLLGSVSNYVTHHANCSVLVVQGQKDDPATT
ncbi:MAG: universal stress protein [Jaaginema sp. PMC 1079.18]|nr:universal stress protein [Jaaginema sp. PMC 1080.18]MEC4849452.1 universal stress protein [Jaaginema sp. PMC 1079.18]MEC4865449.1 universal stress protein [Jaaginema sp. PMC 1078.18]